jgi:hypothetical protein
MSVGPRKERQRELAGSGELAFWVRGRLDAGLMFKEKYRHPETYAKFVDLVMKLAKKRKIDLVGGSSFGLDTTRVYLTARGVKIEDGEPFIRISPGTETRLEMEEIEKLFMEAIERF